MIVFTSIRYKNFLSTGNKFTEVQLNQADSTLVIGGNGSGKSTMLDAMSFALFGKPHRNVKKTQLINSINKKACVVELEFSINKNDFKVVRGLKPAVFEIWKNGTLLNQNSHNKEYQRLLEQNILKLTHKTFHQVVVLGSSSFIPFMQLSTTARREVIEDILDINVFSKMNLLLKERSASIRERTKENDYLVDINQTKLDSHVKYMDDINQLNEEHIAQRRQEIETKQQDLKQAQEEAENMLLELKQFDPDLDDSLRELDKGYGNLTKDKVRIETEMKAVVKEAKFYETNESCPTCAQDIEDSLKSTRMQELKKKATKIQSVLSITQAEMEEVKNALTKAKAENEKLINLQSKLRFKNTSIVVLQAEIGKMLEGINESLSIKSDDLAKAQSDLKDLQAEKNDLSKVKDGLTEERSYNSVMSEMLKDTGIKTKIVKQYIPVINQLVNQYLSIMDFFVHFDLDEQFVEKIRSRHRDDFTYDSFSEGEKQRIDLALLFTWRQVAKMKNSISTNLLVLDETFDASLDQDGIENLTKIINSLEQGTNVFIISHKGDMLEGKFANKLEFYKEKNFSKMRA